MARFSGRQGWLARGTAAALCGAGLSGCATLWDDVTARNFRVGSLFSRDDPMTVLNTSTDGDERAKALRALKEPRRSGGGTAEQDAVLEVLSRSAAADPQPLCRIAAIEALGKFDDPRAVPALAKAYEASNQLTGEAAMSVQCLALKSLGQTKQPQAAQFLVEVAQRPAPAESPDRERQQAQDRRLAAVRALRNYEGSREVADAMVRVLQSEKDVAVRDRARETYATVTGSKAPADEAAAPPLAAPTPTDGFQLTGSSAPKP